MSESPKQLPSQRWLLRIAQQTTQHPRRVLLLLATLTALAAVALPSLRIEPDVSRLLPESNPVVQLGRALEDHTASSRQLVIELSGLDLADQLPRVIDTLRQSPHLDQITATREEFTADSWWKEALQNAPLYALGDEVLEELEQTLVIGRKLALQRGRERLASDPVAGRQVFVEDPLGLRWIVEAGLQSQFPVRWVAASPYLLLEPGNRALIVVRGREVPYNLEFSRRLLEDLRSRLSAAGAGLRIRFYGDYVQARADAARVRRDLLSSGISSLLWVGLFLALTLRRWGDPLRLFIPVLLALAWTLPLGGVLLGSLNALTISSAAILIGLGVDFTIHILSQYSAQRRRGRGHEQAVLETFDKLGNPLLASMLTTVAAFSSLGFSTLRGVRDFGFLLALGLILAFLSSMLLLPLLLRGRAVPAHATSSWAVSMFEKMSRSRGARVGALLLVLTSVGGLTWAALHGIRFSTELSTFRPDDEEVAARKATFEHELGFGLMPIALMFDPVTPPARVAEVIDTLRDEGWIRLAMGVWDVSQSRRQRIATFRSRTRGWRSGTVTDLEALGFKPAPFAEGLEEIERLFACEPQPGSPQRVAVIDREFNLVLGYPPEPLTHRDPWLQFRSRVSELGGDIEVFHVQALLSEMHRLFVHDLTRAAAVTLVIATAFVLLLSGSLVAGLVALIPSLCGFGLTLGLLVMTDTPLNMGNCVAIPFLLGLGVDQGLHLVAHFRRAGGQSTGSVGVAVWRSGVTTLLGFGSLMAASTPGIASLGVLCWVGVGGSLLASLWVLPVLARYLYPCPRDSGAEAGTESELS